jgi:hypothetical protein
MRCFRYLCGILQVMNDCLLTSTIVEHLPTATIDPSWLVDNNFWDLPAAILTRITAGARPKDEPRSPRENARPAPSVGTGSSADTPYGTASIKIWCWHIRKRRP